MKIDLLIICLSLISCAAKAQEFLPPTDEDLMNVSFNFLAESKKIMSEASKKDCDNNKTQEMVRAPEENHQEVFCLCELDNIKKKDKKLLESMIGDYDSTELTLNTGNDNFLHGVLQGTGLRKYDGDDRGRTFGGDIDYHILGSDGELKLGLDSTGFGKFTNVDGYRKTYDGKYYLNFHEVDTLDLRWDKNFSKNDSGKTYLISEFKFTSETDDGHFSRKAQQGWHSFSKNQLGLNAIQYKYISEEEDKSTATIMSGIGKEWIKNLGHWKCQSRLEAKGGMSVDSNGKITPEIAVRAENKTSNSSVPWLALSTWVQGSDGFMGPSVEGGMVLSFERKIKKVFIRPFFGIERHRTPMDKKYGESGGHPYENYHVLGVTIKY